MGIRAMGNRVRRGMTVFVIVKFLFLFSVVINSDIYSKQYDEFVSTNEDENPTDIEIPHENLHWKLWQCCLRKKSKIIEHSRTTFMA